MQENTKLKPPNLVWTTLMFYKLCTQKSIKKSTTQCEPQINQLLISRQFNLGKANKKNLSELEVIYLYSTDSLTFEGHVCVGEKCCSYYKEAGE